MFMQVLLDNFDGMCYTLYTIQPIDYIRKKETT